MMQRLTRAAVALALVAGTATAAGAAQAAAGPEGASQSLFVVDVVVVGTPPPGAAVDVLVPDATGDPQTHHVVLSTTDDTPPDIVTEVGTVARHLFVDPANDAGADAIGYACNLVGNQTTPHPDSYCEIRTTPNAVAPGTHVYAEFWGNVNQIADTVITLTFDPAPPPRCDGRVVTVDLNRGQVPTAQNDVILGTPGGDTVNALGGNDVVCGGGGPDTLRGGDGRDRLLGGAAADRLEGGLLGDTLFGGPGTDTLLGLAGNDALDGGALRDTCNGGTQRDTGARCEVRNGIP